MTAFRKGGFPGFYMRLSRGTRTRVIGLDTTYRDTAELMEGWVRQLRRDRRWDVIDGVLDRAFSLPDAYDHRHELDQWLASRRDVDLDALVAEWDGRGKRARSEKYLAQVRAMIPEGQRFPLSRFRRREIAAFLEHLDVSDPTRNRYKAALSQFAAWLVRHEYLDANPVRDAGLFSERQPRDVHLAVADARRLVDALSGDARTVAAIMAGTSMEWCAVRALTRADVDTAARTLRARGTKAAPGRKNYRDRIVTVTEDWCWPVILSAVQSLAPAAPVVRIAHSAALAEQLAACERLGLPRHLLHDWRHTYAVTALRRRDDPQFVKHQLGHAPNSVLLYKVYGAYITKSPSTKSPTTLHAVREANRAK